MRMFMAQKCMSNLHVKWFSKLSRAYLNENLNNSTNFCYIFKYYIYWKGCVEAQLDEALYYKPGESGFDS
jgi:hypothetical protein